MQDDNKSLYLEQCNLPEVTDTMELTTEAMWTIYATK